MTLITSFRVGDFSFILGDLLLSAPGQGNPSLHLPSIGDVNQVLPLFSSNADYRPVMLSRKVAQFSNVAIAWAGEYDRAKAILARLFEETQNSGPMTLEMFDNVLHTLSPNIQAGLSQGHVALLGYLIDPRDGKRFGFGANYSDLSSVLLDDVRIAGSGSKVFREYFDHRTQSGLNLVIGTGEKTLEAAVNTALALTGMLLQLEIGTYKNLLDLFGGGYELIALKDGQFIPCDDLMYAFWFARVDHKGTTLSPILRFFKQCYYQDVLIIRTLEMNSPDPSNPIFLTGREDEVHYFPPMYRKLTDLETSKLPKPDLSAFLLCSYVLVQSDTGIEVLTKLDWSKRREIPLRFVGNGHTMTVQIQNKHIEDILAAIESRSKH